ncbi:MAG TPA: hypothetical protein VIC61_01205, partial [Gammaproteobacteria bacterium]
ILVGSPKLFEAECRTPGHMRLANAFCRYLELARTVQPGERGGRPSPAADGARGRAPSTKTTAGRS